MTTNPLSNSDHAQNHEVSEEHNDEAEGPVEKISEMIPHLFDPLEQIMEACSVFAEYSEFFIGLPSGYETTNQEVDALRKDIKQHEEDQAEVLNNIRSKLEDDIRAHVLRALRGKDVSVMIRDEVRREAVKQVQEQVDEQIADHMPVSLKDQAEESKRQLQDIRISLENSQSRTNNSFIQTMNLDDPLAPILTPDGSKSPLYPSNVKSLFHYDLPSAKALSKAYGLADSEDLHANYQQFLKHIGTSVEIVSPTGG